MARHLTSILRARILLALLFSILTLVPALVRSADGPDKNYVGALWIAEHDGLLKFATADGMVLLEIPEGRNEDALRGRLWTYGFGELRGYDFAGQLQVTARLPGTARDDHSASSRPGNGATGISTSTDTTPSDG